MYSNVNARNRATSAAQRTVAIIAAACTPRSGTSSDREEGDDEDRTHAHQPQLSPTRTMMIESTAATRAIVMTLKAVAAFMVFPLDPPPMNWSTLSIVLGHEKEGPLTRIFCLDS